MRSGRLRDVRTVFVYRSRESASENAARYERLAIVSERILLERIIDCTLRETS